MAFPCYGVAYYYFFYPIIIIIIIIISVVYDVLCSSSYCDGQAVTDEEQPMTGREPSEPGHPVAMHADGIYVTVPTILHQTGGFSGSCKLTSSSEF